MSVYYSLCKIHSAITQSQLISSKSKLKIPKYWNHSYVETVHRSYQYFVSAIVVQALCDYYLSSIEGDLQSSFWCASVYRGEFSLYGEIYLQTHYLLSPGKVRKKSSRVRLQTTEAAIFSLDHRGRWRRHRENSQWNQPGINEFIRSH